MTWQSFFKISLKFRCCQAITNVSQIFELESYGPQRKLASDIYAFFPLRDRIKKLIKVNGKIKNNL